MAGGDDMDRYDENRHVNDTDEAPSNSQGGDVLGLSGSPVPKMPGDPSASSDPESARRRRERAREDEELLSQEEGDRQHAGATGIDMGSGGGYGHQRAITDQDPTLEGRRDA
jgi:hypothetical protein